MMPWTRYETREAPDGIWTGLAYRNREIIATAVSGSERSVLTALQQKVQKQQHQPSGG